jgi:hypothetical protein
VILATGKSSLAMGKPLFRRMDVGPAADQALVGDWRVIFPALAVAGLVWVGYTTARAREGAAFFASTAYPGRTLRASELGAWPAART